MAQMSGVHIIIIFAITLGFAGKTRYSYDFLQRDTIIIFIEGPKLCPSVTHVVVGPAYVVLYICV